jgi:flagellar biosynthesis chaperone FliJ
VVIKNGYKFNGVHAPVNATDNYSITYDEFVVPLVKAVQEQQQQIEQQKKVINEQQKVLSALKKRLDKLEQK